LKNGECCVVLTTTDNREVAELIAKTLIECRLAACVQIGSVESFFFYDQECCKANEFRLTIKARSDNYKVIEESIKQNHNYQLPQIIKLDITNGLPEYIKWIHSSQ
jgi:periplasmic divalent cation tolerance protein